LIFTETELKEVYLIDLDTKADERGFFARTWDRHLFEQRGLDARLVQCSLSFNHKKGTLRGLHYQVHPHWEIKLVRCTKGAIFDVVVDLRPEAPTFKRWLGVKLTAENRRMVYVPVGCAHGYQTLDDNTEVFYQMSEFYHPEAAAGVRWNDPAFNINWPHPPSMMSEKDASFPDFAS
jgi:dTDP-4-dehydrorhamnose 3,5-epimerase